MDSAVQMRALYAAGSPCRECWPCRLSIPRKEAVAENNNRKHATRLKEQNREAMLLDKSQDELRNPPASKSLFKDVLNVSALLGHLLI